MNKKSSNLSRSYIDRSDRLVFFEDFPLDYEEVIIDINRDYHTI